MRALPIVLLAILGACRSSDIHFRPDVDQSKILPRTNYRSIPVIEGAPAGRPFIELADVEYRSTGLDPYSIAETWLQSRAGEAGADALVIPNRGAIKSIGYTSSLDGVAIRWDD